MGVSASAVSRVTGVDVQFKNFNAGRAQNLPQRLAVVCVGNADAVYTTEKFQGTTAIAVAERYGYGSPAHLVARQFFPPYGRSAGFPITFYPLIPAAEAVAATSEIGATGAATAGGSGKVTIGGVTAEFAIAKGDTAAQALAKIRSAIQGILEMPALAGVVAAGALPLTAKFEGAVGNLITVEFSCDAPGLVFTTEDFSGGALDPDVSTALELIGPVWETVILNCFAYTDTARLDKYQSFGEGRWSVLEKKPCIVAHGSSDDYATRSAVTNVRKTDAINFLVTSVGSRELPFVIAAKGLLDDIMTTADFDPAMGYKGLLTGLHTGADEVQENWATRNLSVLAGASTNIKKRFRGGTQRHNHVLASRQRRTVPVKALRCRPHEAHERRLQRAFNHGSGRN